jgi:RNA chaperone Hfq
MMNRKLVRPKLAEMKEKFAPARVPQGEAPAAESTPATQDAGHAHGGGHAQGQAHGGAAHRRRQVPPENTSAEAFYYVKQMNNHTPMVVVLDNGDQLRGHIEWYDRNCLKVNREGAPNLLVYKHAIKYMYKQEEEIQGAPAPD